MGRRPGLLVHPLLALAGFDLRVVAVCASISYSWQVLEHTSLPIRFPAWFSGQVMTPAAHRHHHGRGSEGVNLGPVLTWWDRLAGTWVPPEVPAPRNYGPAVAASTQPCQMITPMARSANASATRMTSTTEPLIWGPSASGFTGGLAHLAGGGRSGRWKP